MKSKDPHNIHMRLETQIHLLLLEMEEKPELFAFKERLLLVEKVGMYLTRNIKLSDQDEPDTGSAVRKYSGAFQTANVTGGGKTGARSRTRTVVPAPVWGDSGDESDTPDDAA
jgi:hypothetical protein